MIEKVSVEEYLPKLKQKDYPSVLEQLKKQVEETIEALKYPKESFSISYDDVQKVLKVETRGIDEQQHRHIVNVAKQALIDMDRQEILEKAKENAKEVVRQGNKEGLLQKFRKSFSSLYSRDLLIDKLDDNDYTYKRRVMEYYNFFGFEVRFLRGNELKEFLKRKGKKPPENIDDNAEYVLAERPPLQKLHFIARGFQTDMAFWKMPLGLAIMAVVAAKGLLDTPYGKKLKERFDELFGNQSEEEKRTFVLEGNVVSPEAEKAIKEGIKEEVGEVLGEEVAEKIVNEIDNQIEEKKDLDDMIDSLLKLAQAAQKQKLETPQPSPKTAMRL